MPRKTIKLHELAGRSRETTLLDPSETRELDHEEQKNEHQRMTPEQREKAEKILRAYVNACIERRSDGESFAMHRDAQNPDYFSDLYDSKKIDRDLEWLRTRKQGKASTPSLHARAAESLMWQLQKDYRLFGDDIDIVPASEIDDWARGVDFVFFKKLQNSDEPLAVLVDATTRTGERDEDQAMIDYKTYLKFDLGQNRFKYGGVVRTIDYIRSSFFPGFRKINDAHGVEKKTPGLESEHAVLRFSDYDLFAVSALVIDEHTLHPRSFNEVRTDPNAQKVAALLLEKMRISLEGDIEHLDIEISIRQRSGRDKDQIPDIELQRDRIRTTLNTLSKTRVVSHESFGSPMNPPANERQRSKRAVA